MTLAADKHARRAAKSRSLVRRELLRPALTRSLVMLLPWVMARNPVMFVTEVGAIVTTIVVAGDVLAGTNVAYGVLVTLTLWLTVWFANFAEAMAEARGKAQTDALRRTRQATTARRIRDGVEEEVPSDSLRPDDVVRVQAGEVIPSDGEVIEGTASVDESAITGESAPVIREAGGDHSGVTGGTRVLSDWLKVRITAGAGESFLDRMIALVEGAVRQRTPNELALTVTLAGFTLAFLVVTVSLYPIGVYFGVTLPVPTLVALLVCLIPTTIGALLAAIGLAGLDRALAKNVLAKSGRAVELAGDIDTLLLDKTGTITTGNRQASRLLPLPGVTEPVLANAAFLASLGDPTPEGRSILALSRERLGPSAPADAAPPGARTIEFSAHTRLSGIDLDGRGLRKGASDAIVRFVKERGGAAPERLEALVAEVATTGATPVVVADGEKTLGVIALTDRLKVGIRERLARLRAMGLRVIMLTGDNQLTAKALAAEAGVDDFVAEATPEDKLQVIRREQAQGRLVAMMGDGTNDAPALAQADIGVAMNSGTQAAKEAGNLVDLDSDPTKILEVIEIGKQLLMTRGALTTFSIANDVAKYFAIVPAMFALALPQLKVLDVMNLATPQSAILSALIFNALVIPLLIPIALRGVEYRPVGADRLLRDNLLIYGLGGVISPFVGIKLIDLALSATGLV